MDGRGHERLQSRKLAGPVIGTQVALDIDMMRARELDVPLFVNTPVGEEPNGFTPAGELEPAIGALVPPRPRPVRDSLEARLRDIRNPHRRRWRPES
jgi:hypothetical protein